MYLHQFEEFLNSIIPAVVPLLPCSPLIRVLPANTQPTCGSCLVNPTSALFVIAASTETAVTVVNKLVVLTVAPAPGPVIVSL